MAEVNENYLSPIEAIIAMLNGEVLTLGDHPIEERWNGENFVYRVMGEKEWHLKPMDGKFANLHRKPKEQPMDTFECLAWANSPESHGWMVSIKAEHDDDWRSWDLPQRFFYDGKEKRCGSVIFSYRRAKVLLDKSGIDKSTIQGFLKEE